jgi:hypothetical protein
LLTLLLTVVAACSGDPFPGEQEEIPTRAEDVPDVVRAAAAKICERLGGARCQQWFWDTEDQVWEVTLTGLPRRAELDITPDGTFSELELVHELSEVEQVLPDVAKLIKSKCRTDRGILIELSLRREAYLDNIPSLAQAWAMSGVVLEFQAPNGRDFEIDARGMCITRPVDDRKDPADGSSTRE